MRLRCRYLHAGCGRHATWLPIVTLLRDTIHVRIELALWGSNLGLASAVVLFVPALDASQKLNAEGGRLAKMSSESCVFPVLDEVAG